MSNEKSIYQENIKTYTCERLTCIRFRKHQFISGSLRSDFLKIITESYAELFKMVFPNNLRKRQTLISLCYCSLIIMPISSGICHFKQNMFDYKARKKQREKKWMQGFTILKLCVLQTRFFNSVSLEFKLFFLCSNRFL